MRPLNSKIKRPRLPRAFWRRGQDSNLRYWFCQYNTLAGCRLRPLGHLSTPLAEGEGFEPPVGIKPTAVFKTATFNRSANPPKLAARPLCARLPSPSRAPRFFLASFGLLRYSGPTLRPPQPSSVPAPSPRLAHTPPIPPERVLNKTSTALKAISLFTEAGGLDFGFGFEAAGFRRSQRGAKTDRKRRTFAPGGDLGPTNPGQFLRKNPFRTAPSHGQTKPSHPRPRTRERCFREISRSAGGARPPSRYWQRPSS
jgi:hypothetical protein